MDGIVMLGDNINKIIEVTQERKKEREKVIGAQLEISRLNLKAAKKQKKNQSCWKLILLCWFEIQVICPKKPS